MAGIGFELRKLLRKESYLGLFQAYAYAGVISSGPWILSIIGVQLIGLFSLSVVIPQIAVQQFQVSVTYLLAFSLILTGPLQLAFTRYVADRLFEKRDDMIVPNFMGAQLITALVSGLLLTTPATRGTISPTSSTSRMLWNSRTVDIHSTRITSRACAGSSSV